MKRFNLIAILLISLNSILSCSSSIDNDEEIIKSIFPQIVDSLEIRHIKTTPPPPNPDGSINPELKKWRKEMEIIESQKKMIILIEDTLSTIENDNFKISRVLDNQAFSILKESLKKNKSSRKIDLNQLNDFEKYEFLYFSNHRKPGTQLFDIKDKKFGGLLSFSRVYLNEDKNIGILKLSHISKYDNGQGYIVTIKRVKNKWKVVQIHFDWIS